MSTCAAKSVIFCWGMGITQHQNSVATIQTMTNLLMMRGQPRASPVRGACPVAWPQQCGKGDRTMGIWEKPPAALLDSLRDVFWFSSQPRGRRL